MLAQVSVSTTRKKGNQPYIHRTKNSGGNAKYNDYNETRQNQTNSIDMHSTVKEVQFP